MRRVLCLLVLLLAIPLALSAQATRTWVSGVGDDANPCSRTAPCKTFAGAISKTAAGGEISVLDPGGYGAVTITKAITIDGTGTMASILAAGTTGIVVNAGGSDIVTIRGLSINGAGTGITGIRYIGGKALIIEDCVVFGFTSRGLSAELNNGTVTVIDTVFRNNTSIGAVVRPGGQPLRAVFDNVRSVNNGSHGFYFGGGARVTLRNSVASNNGSVGLYSEESIGSTDVNIEHSVVSNNTYGIWVGPGPSETRLTNTSIMNNVTGLVFDGGAVISFGNNRIFGNAGGNGPPTSTVPEQ